MSSSTSSETDADFTAFVAAHSGRLLHVSRLLVGDRGAAEDLLQTVLTRAYPRWSRIEQDDPVGYVRRGLVNAATDRWRHGSRREVPVEIVPDRPGQDHRPGPDDDLSSRLAVLAALAQLSPRERAVVVLRYYEDLTEAQTADHLGLPLGTVKSLHHRALRKLGVSADLHEDALTRTGHERSRR